LNASVQFHSVLKDIAVGRQVRRHDRRGGSWIEGIAKDCKQVPTTISSSAVPGMQLSPWSRSHVKRFFDCACILPLLPLLVPVCLAIALVVRIMSPGPVFFLQKRMGRYGRTFTIIKFRTMIHSTVIAHQLITTESNQRFTPIGPLLRRWKLDELPQLINVLLGDMSLVGPRPKIREHQISVLPCRPGLTGAATIAFADEETVLDRVSKHRLDFWYQEVALPAKRRLDSEYMAHATFLSDLNLIVKSVLRRWDKSAIEAMLRTDEVETEETIGPFNASISAAALNPRDRSCWPQKHESQLDAGTERVAAQAAD